MFKEEGLSFGTEKIGSDLMEDEWNSKVGIIDLLLFESQLERYQKDSTHAKRFAMTDTVFFQKGFYAPHPEAVRARAAALRVWLYGLEAQHVVLVTHGGFLHCLNEDGTVSDPKKGISQMYLTSSLENCLITNRLWLHQL